jgi:hypothetical protein
MLKNMSVGVCYSRRYIFFVCRRPSIVVRKEKKSEFCDSIELETKYNYGRFSLYKKKEKRRKEKKRTFQTLPAKNSGQQSYFFA